MMTINLNGWVEFENQINKLYETHPKSSGFLFRGLPDSTFDLSTTLERHVNEEFSISDYYRIISRAQSEIQAFTDLKWDIPQPPEFSKKINTSSEPWVHMKISQSVYSYMVYLRHHGFPSPLLDWSRSAYIAAYFAFRMPFKPKSEKVSIFAFSERPDGVGIATSPQEPHVSMLGQYVTTHKRHFLQQCNYTICTRYDAPKQKWLFANHHDVLSKENPNKTLCWKFTLPWLDRITALKALDKYNLNANSLFESEESLMETMTLREWDFKTKNLR